MIDGSITGRESPRSDVQLWPNISIHRERENRGHPDGMEGARCDDDEGLSNGIRPRRVDIDL